MSIRVRRPETVRLALAGGDWLLVRKFLTAGETRRMYRRMMRRNAAGDGDEMDPMEIGPVTISAYLVDWSVLDADNAPIAIAGQTPEFIYSVLEMLDPDAFTEMWRAVQEHELAIDEEKKRIPTGEPKSYPILPLPASTDGGTNG